MSFILLILGLAAALWTLIFLLRGSPLTACLGFLLSLACFGYDFVSFDLGPLPLTLDRLVLIALMAGFIVQWKRGRIDAKGVMWVDAAVTGFVLLLGLSALSHRSVAPLPGDVTPMARFVIGYLTPLVVYWIARQSRITEGGVNLAHAALACFGVYLATTGLAEMSGQWWLVYPRYIADPEVGLHFGRARGPMVQSVSYGLCLAICLLAAWSWRSRLGRLGQLILIGLMPLFLAAAFVSYTRSVWLGTAGGILVVLGLTLRGAWRPLLIGAIASACLLAAVVKFDTIMGFAREGSAAQTRDSASMRTSFTYVSWKMFQERPLLGFGFGQFPRVKDDYLHDRGTSLYLEGVRGYVHHNTFLSLLTEVGLAGMLLFIASLAGWGAAAWRLWRSENSPPWAKWQAVLMLAALVVYLCQALFHELSYSPLDNVLLFFLAGVTTGLAAKQTAHAATRQESQALWQTEQAPAPQV